MIATYRLQLTPDFGFAQARRFIPYLRALGITHVYLSPITEARPGSTHGYDVVDPNAVRAELGGALQFQLLLATLRQQRMHVILDIVPNHAGLGPQNLRFQDVLAYGPHSPYARYFDIEWHPLKPELRNKILLPVLGQNYGEVLLRGDIDIKLASSRLYATYGEGRYALKPSTYRTVLLHVLPHLDITEASRRELSRLCDRLMAWHEPDRAQGEEMVGLIHDLLSDAQFAEAWQPLSPDVLHSVLEQQFWRLANWRNASHEVNYRRFFDINDLIGLRVEDPRVFSATHRLVKELLCDDVVVGLRIDHVDGLADPSAYLERLRTLGARHVWVEKILANNETMPMNWPVDGTTGYEFMADVIGVCTDARGRAAMTRLYRRYVGGEAVKFAEEVYRSKRLIMSSKLAGELQRLAFELDRLSEANYATRDYTLQALRDGLVEVIAAQDRYRTYLPHERTQAKRVLHRAVSAAARRNVSIDRGIYDFIARMLTDEDAGAKPQHAAWVSRFQQYTAPVTAKGVEDTAFYRFHRLVALNEVGCHPGLFGISARTFHRRVQARGRRFPRNLLATATHDTKRGEDLRLRVLLLPQMVRQWAQTVRALHCATRLYCQDGMPSRSDRYLFFQMLVALWQPGDPELPERLAAYMIKAAREAKLHTSWNNPVERYEEALTTLVLTALRDTAVAQAVAPLAKRLAEDGLVMSMTQLILKCTTPGVPDFYRGCEFLDLCMVDPDNRRPVDFATRQRRLEALTSLCQEPHLDAVRELLHNDADGMKLYTTMRLLKLRHQDSDLVDAAYQPLAVHGKRHRHVLAYQRGNCVIIVPRFYSALRDCGGLGDARIELPAGWAHGGCVDWLTDAEVHVSKCLTLADLPLPWAVLRRRNQSSAQVRSSP